MADMMTLDMSGGGGEDGLLVPFSRPTAPAADSRPTNESEALFSNNHQNNNNNNGQRRQSNRGFGGFFRRTNSSYREKENDEQKNLPLKATTFAFPKACVEQADIDDPFTDITKKEKEPQNESDDDESSGDDDEESDDDGYETDEDEEQPKEAPSLKKMDDWDPTENPYYTEETEQSRPWRMEGFGSVAPPLSQSQQQEKPRNGGIGGFLHRFRNNNNRRGGGGGDPELRTMKVATEDTKDDKTMVEQVAKAALVVLVPELFDEDDGDGNLGMYRTLNTATDEDADAKLKKNARGVALTNEVGWGVRNFSASLGDDPSLVVRNEVRQLRQKVIQLDKSLKSAELEANSWKLRCKELEQELRRYRGQSDLDSSIDADEDSDEEDEEDEEESDEDDGIEEEWTGYDSVKVGNLLEIPAKEEENKPSSSDDDKAKEADTEINLLDLPSTETNAPPETPSLLDLPPSDDDDDDKATPEEVDDAPSMLDMTFESFEKPKEPEAPSLMDLSGGDDDITPKVDDSPSLLDLTDEQPAPMVFDPLNEEVSVVDAEMAGNNNA